MVSFAQVAVKVVDRLANVCDTYDGEFELELSEGARVVGGAPPKVLVVGGRGVLAVICTQVMIYTYVYMYVSRG